MHLRDQGQELPLLVRPIPALGIVGAGDGGHPELFEIFGPPVQKLLLGPPRLVRRL